MWKRIGLKVLAAALVFAGIEALAIGDFGIVGICLGSVLLVAGVVVWSMSGKDKSQGIDDAIEVVGEAEHMSVRDLQEVFVQEDFFLGKPWVGTIRHIQGECLIFGPTVRNQFIYISKGRETFYISISSRVDLLVKPPKTQLQNEADMKDLMRGIKELAKEYMNN